MTELRSHPDLLLREHLAQIHEAAEAIWCRHSAALRENCAEAFGWFVDAVTWHDAGKGSPQFQEYIADTSGYMQRHKTGDKKVHTPLSAVLTLLYSERQDWDWRRALAVTVAARGHHSRFLDREDLSRSLAGDDTVIGEQTSGLNWAALDDAVAAEVPRPDGRDGTELVADASNHLDDLLDDLDELAKAAPAEAVRFRLLAQLVFSVLLEADKAYLKVKPADLPAYLGERSADMPPSLVTDFIAGKPTSNVNDTRRRARVELEARLNENVTDRVQTLTLPTGAGKTLLAATWALTHRDRLARNGPRPLVLIVLPYLSVIEQTASEWTKLLKQSHPGEMVTYHSLSDRTFGEGLEDESQEFFLDTWQSDVVITTFDQFLLALFSPRAKHQMRFHHLTDALIVMDEIQAVPCVLWDPLHAALKQLVTLGESRVLCMTATQPGFLPAPRELIRGPGPNYFAPMRRYRLALRHREPTSLDAFIDECLGRREEWAGKRVMLTLNTRRSARRVRDALATAGEEVDFITADVAPADRLEVIKKIKGSEPCLVVSTQCIEAGVDIDMGLIVRDFAPLDSLVQIAGRCNRGGGRERGTVEVVCLTDADNKNSPLHSYVYDGVLMQETATCLAGRDEVPEEDVFDLVADYYRRLGAVKDKGEAETRAWAKWEEMTKVRHLLRGPDAPQVTFVVIKNDETLVAELDAARAITGKDARWKRRSALRRLASRVAKQSVTVRRRDGLDPSHFADHYPSVVDPKDAWFWLLRDDHYTRERGLDL